MIARHLIREHARERQAWERERTRLVATICHLAGNPLPEERVDPVHVENGREDLLLIPDPSQLPDY